MRSVAKRRFPILLIIFFALVGIAVSVTVGRIIAGDADKTATAQSAVANRL